MNTDKETATMPHPLPPRTARQRGMNLLEVTLALALASGVGATAYHFLDTGHDDAKARQLAWQQQTLAQAARRFMIDHYAELHNTPGMAAFTEATDNTPTVRAIPPSLYLPPAFASGKNIAGRYSCLITNRPASATEPLKALLVTRGLSGKTPDSALARAAALAMSESTGLVTDLTGRAFTARAVDGSWQVSVTQPAYPNDAQDEGCSAMLATGALSLAKGDLVTSLTVDDPSTADASQALWRHQDTTSAGLPNRNTLLTTTTVRTDADGQGQLAFYGGAAPAAGTDTATTLLDSALPDTTHPASGRTLLLSSGDLLSVDSQLPGGGALTLANAGSALGVQIGRSAATDAAGLSLLNNAVMSWGTEPLILKGTQYTNGSGQVMQAAVIVHPGIRIAPDETQAHDPASGFRDIGKTRIYTLNGWKNYDQVRATDLARWNSDTPDTAMEMTSAPCPVAEWGTLLPIKDTPQVAICLPTLPKNTVVTPGIDIHSRLTGKWYFLAMSTVPLNSKDVRDGIRWMASSQMTGIGNRAIDPDGFMAQPVNGAAGLIHGTPGVPTNEELWSAKGQPLWPVRPTKDQKQDE